MIWIWIGFVAFVLLMLALDLGVFHRKAHVVSVKEAIAWSAVWLALGSAFAVFVYFAYDGQWFGLGAVADPVDGLPNDGSTATEYHFDYAKAKPNRFAARVRGGPLVVILDEEIARVFKTPEAVKAVLRAIVATMPTRRKGAGARRDAE